MIKNWKLFGKLHLFDLVVLLLMVFVLIGLFNRLTGGKVGSLIAGSQVVPMTVVLETYPCDALSLENLKVGDQLGENKSFMNGQVTAIDIQDYYHTLVDNHGQPVYGVDPDLKISRVTLDLMADYKKPIYSFGQQELRVGISFFIITETAYLSATVIDMQEKKN